MSNVIDDAKEVGAVVHKDGNIFFTNATKLEALKRRWQREALEEANHEKLLNELNRIKKDLCSGRGGGGCSN